jgi:hypothetical protein
MVSTFVLDLMLGRLCTPPCFQIAFHAHIAAAAAPLALYPAGEVETLAETWMLMEYCDRWACTSHVAKSMQQAC